MLHIFVCQFDVFLAHQMTHKSLVGYEQFIASRTVFSFLLINIIIVASVPSHYFVIPVLLIKNLTYFLF